MATIAELDDSVRAARDAGCQQLILLKCTSTYPSTPENTNIVTIPHLKELFGCQVGISDHTLGIGVSVASVALGGTVIEKHFTLDRYDGGVDSTFSMEPAEMSSLVIEAERAWQSLGKITYGPTVKEQASLKHRRSLYLGENMKAGEILTKENVRIIRPGKGLSPKYFETILGARLKQDTAKGTPLDWNLLI